MDEDPCSAGASHETSVMIGRTLAHKNVSTRAIYARLNLNPVKESMPKAATAMWAAGGLLPSADLPSMDQVREQRRRK